MGLRSFSMGSETSWERAKCPVSRPARLGARDYVPEEATPYAGDSVGAEEHLAVSLEEQVAVWRRAETGKGSGCSLCAESAGAASLSEGKAEEMHWSASRGEGGESIALPSEETGLAQRPSPCKYRMHFFFLLRTVKRVSCE